MIRNLLDKEERKVFREWLVLVLLTIAAAAVAVAWFNDPEPPAEAPTVRVADPAPEIRDVPLKEVVPKKPVKVYKGGAALKDGLKLPRPVVDSPAEEVIASTKVDHRDERPKTITTVLNTETGESTTYERIDPLPWIATDTRGSVGAYVGFKRVEPALRIEARQDILDIKSVRLGARASVDLTNSGNVDSFVGIGGSYHW